MRELRTWQRVHIRLTLLYGGTIFLVLMVLGAAVYFDGVKTEKEALQQRLLGIVTSLASSVDGAAVGQLSLEGNEFTELHQRLKERFKQVAEQDPDVETIYMLRPTQEPTKLRFVVDYVKDGEEGQPGEAYDATDVPVMLQGFSRPSVEDEPYTDEFGTTLSGYAPIMTQDGRSIALVGIDVKASRLAAMRQGVMRSVLWSFGAAVVLLGIISAVVARNLRTPLSRIIDASMAIARGELNTRIGMQRSDELGLMSRHIDLMAEQLQEREFIRETFGRYVSEEVAKSLLEQRADLKLGGEERVVTVLFSDIRGYSTVSEQMPAVHVVDLLNRYLGKMTEIIDKHHGCVIEFVGDAIFAAFGAPHYFSDHAESAVRCAIEMRQRLAQLNEEWTSSGLARYWRQSGMDALNARIGIHTGRVVAGNLGSATRMKYAVIGDTVNVAARLETLNKELNTDILLSRDVYVHLPEELTEYIAEKGEHHVKGREQSVKVYSIGEVRPALTVVSS